MSERQNWWKGLFLSKSSGFMLEVAVDNARQDIMAGKI
jgi:hypothetical protein